MITKEDWESIYVAIESAQKPTEIVYAIVVKRDEKHRLVWVDEFGDMPIPLIGFQTTTNTYDIEPVNHITDPDLDVEKRLARNISRSEVVVPAVGATVVILRQFGRRRLPKCIGEFLTIGNYNPEDL